MITREEASPYRVDTEHFLPDIFPRCFAGTLNPNGANGMTFSPIYPAPPPAFSNVVSVTLFSELCTCPFHKAGP